MPYQSEIIHNNIIDLIIRPNSHHSLACHPLDKKQWLRTGDGQCVSSIVDMGGLSKEERRKQNPRRLISFQGNVKQKVEQAGDNST